MRVGVGNVRALFAQNLHDFQRRRFAHVADIFFVGDSEHQHGRAAHRLAGAVERVRGFGREPGRHAGVDFAGQLNELGMHAVFARLPREVERVNRQAVAAEAGPRVIRRVAERLGGGRVYDFKDVQPHRVAHLPQFIDQADVDRAVNVFHQLGHLGGARGTDRHHAVHRGAVERGADFQAVRGVPGAEFRNFSQRKIPVAGVFALRRIHQKHILARGETARGDARQQFLLGGAGVGGALQRDHAPGAQVRRDRVHGGGHIAQVRLAVRAERRRHADDQRVRARALGKVGGGGEAGIARALDFAAGNALYVTFAGVERAHFVFVNVKAGGFKAGLGEAQRERQADIAEPEHRDARAAIADFFQKRAFHCGWRYARYHSANFARPSSTEVSGVKPKAPRKARMSARVAATSPGCIGSIFQLALRPSASSSARM